MRYVGLYSQQRRNNLKSLLLLLLFPCILLAVVYAFLVLVAWLGASDPAYGEMQGVDWGYVNYEMQAVIPWVLRS